MSSNRQFELDPKLVLLALFVLTAHALLLGLLQGIRSAPVDGIADGSVVFQTRLIALVPPQSALPAVAAAALLSAPNRSHIEHRPAPPSAAVRAAEVEHTPPSNTPGIEPLPDRSMVATATPQAAQPGLASKGALDAGIPESRSTARLPRPATITYQAYVTQNAPRVLTQRRWSAPWTGGMTGSPSTCAGGSLEQQRAI